MGGRLRHRSSKFQMLSFKETFCILDFTLQTSNLKLPLVRRRCHSWIILHQYPASSAYGRSEVFPPMNRRNPASGRMARCYGSRCGTKGSDYPLNRLFSSPRERRMPSGDGPIPCYWPTRRISRARRFGRAGMKAVRESRMNPNWVCHPRKEVDKRSFTRLKAVLQTRGPGRASAGGGRKKRSLPETGQAPEDSHQVM